MEIESLYELIDKKILNIEYGSLYDMPGADPWPWDNPALNKIHNFDQGVRLYAESKIFDLLWAPQRYPGGLILEEPKKKLALKTIDALSATPWNNYINLTVRDVKVGLRDDFLTAVHLFFPDFSVIFTTGTVESSGNLTDMPDELVAIFDLDTYKDYLTEINWYSKSELPDFSKIKSIEKITDEAKHVYSLITESTRDTILESFYFLKTGDGDRKDLIERLKDFNWHMEHLDERGRVKISAVQSILELRMVKSKDIEEYIKISKSL